MDNILKLVVGCLGLVGLIVMIIPNSDPLAKNNADATAQNAPADAAAAANGAAPPPPPPPPDPNAGAQPAMNDVVVEDYDIGTFGQPMVDPTPPGQRQQQQAQPFQPGVYGPQPNGAAANAGAAAQSAADAATAAGNAANAAVGNTQF